MWGSRFLTWRARRRTVRTVDQALDALVDNRPADCAALMLEAVRGGEREAWWVWRRCAEVISASPDGPPTPVGPGGFVGIRFRAVGSGEPVDPDQIEDPDMRGFVAAVRFVTAFTNQDDGTALAIFRGLAVPEDMTAWMITTRHLVEMAAVGRADARSRES